MSLRKRNGFTLVEVIAATSILISTITIVAPITSTVLEGKTVLNERRTITNALHDELQIYLQKKVPKDSHSYSKTVGKIMAAFQFTNEKEFIKGCVSWNNAKGNKEEFCLYGLPY